MFAFVCVCRLARGRAILWMMRQPLVRKSKNARISYNYVLMKTNSNDLNRLKQLVEDQAIHAVVERTYKLEEIKDAFKHIESGRTKGKVVIALS